MIINLTDGRTIEGVAHIRPLPYGLLALLDAAQHKILPFPKLEDVVSITEEEDKPKRWCESCYAFVDHVKCPNIPGH